MFTSCVRGSRPTIAGDYEDIREVAKAEGTFDAMLSGVPLIHQGVLWDAENRVYGAADLLVRSDVLSSLFAGALSEEEAVVAAPSSDGWHYRVVDAKFTTLHLAASGELANAGLAAAHKVQLWLYNRALGRLQGYEPPTSHLLGRGWEQRGDRGLTRWTVSHLSLMRGPSPMHSHCSARRGRCVVGPPCSQ